MYQQSIIKSLIQYKDNVAFEAIDNKRNFIFIDKENAKLFEVISQLKMRFDSIPDLNFLNEYFKGERDSEAKNAYEAIFNDDLIQTTTHIQGLAEQQLKHYVKTQSKETLKRYLAEFKIANNSNVETLGNELISDLHSINRALIQTQQSEGVIYYDGEGENVIKDTLCKEYDMRKSGARGYYKFKTGFPTIDKVLGGIHNVEFMGIMGYVKNGKSYLARQIGYNVLTQTKNVVFITLEMSYESILLSFLALHANNVNFWGNAKQKIKVSDIRSGTLAEDIELFYKEQVIDDFTTNANLGSLYIKQPTESSYTPQKLFADIKHIQSTIMDIDLIIIDYPALMMPSTNRRDRESYNELYREIRHFGLTNNLPILFVIQSNRQGFLNAIKDKNKLYSTDAIAEYSAIEKECSNIISILTTNEMRALGQSQIQHIISRETMLFKPFLISADFECGELSEVTNIEISNYKELLEIIK